MSEESPVIMNPYIEWFAPILEYVKCSCGGNTRLLKWINKENGNLVWCEKCGCLHREYKEKLVSIYEHEYSVVVFENMKQ